MRKLAITYRASKTLADLPAKQYKQVVSAILRLPHNPEPHDSLHLKSAKHGERRIDTGEYRIIYTFTDDTVEILLIGKRNDDQVYREWERKR